MASVRRIAMLSVHTCPLASLGGKKTGGMNVYVRELSREFGRRGIEVDVYTRCQESCIPHLGQQISENARVIHVDIVAHGFVPFNNGSLGNAFAHFWQ